MTKLFEVMLNDLRLTKKNFNRLLSVGMLFALFGHFYIVEPYFRYKAQERSAGRELKGKQTKFKELSKQLSRLDEANKGIDSALREIKNQIQKFPDHLQSMLPKIDNAVSSTLSFQAYQQSRPRNIESIAFPPGVTTFQDGVRWYTKNWFSNVIAQLEEGVIKPVLGLEEEKETASGNKLDSLSKNAREKIHAFVENVDPDFWRSYGTGKVPVAKGLEATVEESFNPIYEETESLMREIRNEKEKQKKGVENIKNEIDQVQGHVEKLESMIESIESPIGRIPLNLVNFNEIFPLLMVVLIVMLTFYLYRSKKLHTALSDETAKNDVNKNKINFQYLAGCWYLPPYQSIIQPLLLGISVIIILGVFTRSTLLVVVKPELFISITGEVEYIRKLIFISAYMIGALIIIGCLWFSLNRPGLKAK